MKIFEGKTPAERNKIIAVIVLGTLAAISLIYTFGGLLIPGRSASPVLPALDSPSPVQENAAVTEPVPGVSSNQAQVDKEYVVTPVTYAGGRFEAPISGRNIFAFYEPPDFTPTPTVEPSRFPTFTPTPLAPVTLSFLSPNSAYAGSKDFRIEVVGDKFTPETRIIFNSNALPTSFLSEQRLSATVPASLIARSGAGSVSVNTPDGKLYSYPVTFNIIEPPRPDFDYIGLIARQHYNNDTAYFQDRGRRNEEPFTARLNDVVKGRFKVISISAEQVEFEDVRLGFHHKLPLLRPEETSGSSSSSPGVSFDNDDTGDEIPVNIPGIPSNIPRAPRVRTINPNRRDLNRAIEEAQKAKQKQDDNEPQDDQPEPPTDEEPPNR